MSSNEDAFDDRNDDYGPNQESDESSSFKGNHTSNLDCDYNCTVLVVSHGVCQLANNTNNLNVHVNHDKSENIDGLQLCITM